MGDHLAFNRQSSNYSIPMMRIFLIFLFGISLAYSKSSRIVRESCEYPKKCVQRHLCINGYMNVDGRNVINFRFGEIAKIGCDVFSVCCAPNENKKNAVAPRPSNEDSNHTKGCGYSNKLGLHITLANSTNEAQIGEFPWVVIVLDRSTNVPLGGGSLIAPNVVLTKAKNLENINPGNLLVRAGEWDKKTRNELHRHVDKDVSLIEFHQRYNSLNGDYNAALLILKSSFTIAPNISPICLAPSSKNFDNLRCFVAGWGKDNYDANYFMDIQKKIDLPMINRNQCQNQLRAVKVFGEDFQLQESLICAGGEVAKDACTGDGGGPLFCPMDNQPDRFEQVGIVNWGFQCGLKDIPAAYTSVSLIRSWIDQKMIEHSVDKSFYTP